MPTNPIISTIGKAMITPRQHCTWETPTHGNSKLIISNLSNKNPLKFSIAGAPVTKIAVMVNGISVPCSDGIFVLAPNNISALYIALGDFKNATVTITNLTSERLPANAKIITKNA